MMCNMQPDSTLTTLDQSAPSPTIEEPLLPRGQGLVIAFHCVPGDVEPNIEKFWIELRLRLQAQGQELLLATTASVTEPQLPHLRLPFHLPDIGGVPGQVELADPRLVQTISNWYRIGHVEAAAVWCRVHGFVAGLLDSTQPAAVISWQSTHPLSRLTRQACLSRDIPWWCAERGWLRDTLTVDTCENNALSEVSRSLGLRRAYGRYEIPEPLPQAVRDRFHSGASARRYPQDAPAQQVPLRQRLGLASDARVFAWLTHGEPHVNSIANASVQANHGMNKELLQAELLELATELERMGAWLVVREHPFNAIHGRCLDIHGLSNVLADDGDLDELMDQADFFLFTLSTLQFEVALRGKPFGLLARSLLSEPGEAPFRGDFGDCSGFLRAFTTTAEWAPRCQAILRKVCFLYENQLLDLAPDQGRRAAQELADLLSGCNGARVADAVDGLTALRSASSDYTS